MLKTKPDRLQEKKYLKRKKWTAIVDILNLTTIVYECRFSPLRHHNSLVRINKSISLDHKNNRNMTLPHLQDLNGPIMNGENFMGAKMNIIMLICYLDVLRTYLFPDPREAMKSAQVVKSNGRDSDSFCIPTSQHNSRASSAAKTESSETSPKLDPYLQCTENQMFGDRIHHKWPFLESLCLFIIICIIRQCELQIGCWKEPSLSIQNGASRMRNFVVRTDNHCLIYTQFKF